MINVGNVKRKSLYVDLALTRHNPKRFMIVSDCSFFTLGLEKKLRAVAEKNNIDIHFFEYPLCVKSMTMMAQSNLLQSICFLCDTNSKFYPYLSSNHRENVFPVLKDKGWVKNNLTTILTKSLDGLHLKVEYLDVLENLIITMILKEFSPRQISRNIGICEKRVSYHKRCAMKKLGTRSVQDLHRLYTQYA